MMQENTVLVTGSSRGIGRAVALRLAEEGYDIALHCRERREAAEVVAEQIRLCGRRVRILQFDVSHREESASALLRDMEEHGCYYGVVANAGVTRDNAFPAMSGEDWDTVMRVDLDSFYNVLNPVCMPMIQRRKPGRIVTLASVSGIMGNRGQVNYSAAKAGIIGATKALAVELASRKITVNCVAPGLIETEMLPEQVVEEALKIIPMKRVGTAEEVAATVCFLMSPEAGYITRQVISVNGGMV